MKVTMRFSTYGVSELYQEQS
jgi:hypothetical protein